MTQVVNTLDSDLDLNSSRHVKNDSNPALRNATAIQDLLQKVVAAYSEDELQGLLLECGFQILTRAENGNPDIVEVPIEILGHSTEVRELNWAHVQDLVMSDEHTWPPLEVCLWPEYLPKLDLVALLRIISGNHRTAAAKEKGLSSLPVRIFRVEKEVDFRVLAIRSNASHGLNFTEDEYKKQAAYLKQEGKTLTDIASILSKNKSTISRWLSGADSNASRKIGKIIQPQQVDPTTTKPLIRTVPTIAQKIETLLIGENMSVNVQEARTYIQNISDQKQQRLQALFAWLQEAMEG